MLTLATVIASIGSSCSRSESGPPVHPVQGQVSFRGESAEGALVVFHPIDELALDGTRPRGYVSEDGSFQLTTRTRDDGAPAGNYAVTVVWRDDEDEDDPGPMLIPVRYANPAHSGLRAEIVAGENELSPFELTH